MEHELGTAFWSLHLCIRCIQRSSSMQLHVLCSLALLAHASAALHIKPQLVRRVLGTWITTASLLFNQPLLHPAGAADDDAYLHSLAAVLEAKAVLKRVPQFVSAQAYDNARTNIKYCLNQLRLQKQLDTLVKNSIDFAEDPDAVDAAADASTRIANTATQLDSTVYTLIFIPTEDGELPPSAEKYIKQSNDFYSTLEKDLDLMLKVASDSQLSEAQSISDKELKDYPGFLFKDPSKKTSI